MFSVLVVRLRHFFFFSSRRRHTRSLCDWSSDVCSSDLGLVATRVPQDPAAQPQGLRMGLEPEGAIERQQRAVAIAQPEGSVPQLVPDERSEERRVGKECRSRGWQQQSKKNEEELEPVKA